MKHGMIVLMTTLFVTQAAFAGWETVAKVTKGKEGVEVLRVLTPEVLKDCDFRLRGVYEKAVEVFKGGKVSIEGSGYSRISFVDVSQGCCGEEEISSRSILVKPDNSISFGLSYAKNASELELSMKCE